MKRLAKLFLVAALLLLAAVLRWHDIDREGFGGDGTQLLIKSIQVVRHGQFTLIGVPMSAGTSHSPLTVYLYGLPVLLSPDQRVAFWFTGAFHLFTAALLFKLSQRYFGFSAGVAALTLFAVHPEALYQARQVLNTVLGAPFAMAFVLTGLLGYYENKTRWRKWHLPFLFFAAQCHPGAIFLLPLTTLLFVFAFWNFPQDRTQIFRDTLLSGGLGLLLFAPWGIGIAQQLQGRSPDTAFEVFTNRGWDYTFERVSSTVTGWSPSWAKEILPWLTLAGFGWVVLALRGRKKFVGIIVALGFLLIPLMFLITNTKFRDTYFWPAFPLLFPILGAVVGGVFDWLRRQTFLAWAVWLIVLIIARDHLNFFNSTRTLPPTLGDYTQTVNEAYTRAQNTQRDLLMLIPYGAGAEYDYFVWEVLNEGRVNSRVVWHGKALPLPKNGAVIVTPINYDGRDALLTDPQTVRTKFKTALLPPADQFKPNLILPAPVKFNNGVTVNGFLTRQPLSPDSNWSAYMLWTQTELQGKEDGLFVHLIDAQGNKFAQVDVPALPVGQQRVGELVLSQLDFKLPPNLPREGELFFRFGFTHVGDSVVQIRGAAKPTLMWTNGLTLDSVRVSQTVPQGVPLEVNATWFTKATLPNLNVRLTVNDVKGKVILEKIEGLKIEAGAYTSHAYTLRVPTDLVAGVYTVEVSLVDERGNKVESGYQVNAEVTARPRKFSAPPIQKVVVANFTDQIRLLGFDQKIENKKLALTLHWQALRQMENSYKFFAQLLKDGDVKAQWDALPDETRYLTLWWAKDEVWSETVTLEAEAGRYTLITGWYDVLSQERLGEVVTLGEVELR